ncbi:E3 ubiquitin-protein ligase ZNF598-like [Watersipora subatra]|uniref:E3 ubiquitin-protein ligase ZNF598-like n=1 Tax=Watersipora subatra TaxID=2589382 RepID=UPI00355B585E
MDSPSISTCSICHEEENIHALAPCNHHICFKCSTRLRLLHQQYYCPICRADCTLVLFVHTIDNYSSYRKNTFIKARRLKALFEDKVIEDAVNHLTAHDCYVCAMEGHQETFDSFKKLQGHIKKQHRLYFCEICVEFVKIFSFERKAYSRTDLALHKRKGDSDDTSFKGHPLCQLCDNRYLDTDELWRHLRKDHFFCHFCDADGSHIYFGNYPSVKDHFKEAHFLCEDGDCADAQFTNAFRSDIDLIAHKAQSHPKGKKNQQRQSRVLPVQFNYAKEYQRRPNREKGTVADDPGGTCQEKPASRVSKPDDNNSKKAQEEIDIARGIAASLELTTTASNPPLDVESALDFPSLHGDVTASASTTVTSSPRAQKKRTAARASGLVLVDDNEEFPNLSSTPSNLGSVTASQGYANTTAKASQKVLQAPQKASKQVAPAAVKAKSNPWNNTEDEFPTLEKAKVTTSVPSWHVTKPQPKPARPSFVTQRKPVLNSASDFPTLGSGASSSLASIGSWIRGNSSPKQPAPAPKIANATADCTNSQLNYYQGAPDSIFKSKKGKKKEKQNCSEEKGDKLVSLASTEAPSKKIKEQRLQAADKANVSTNVKSGKKSSDAQSKGTKKETSVANGKLTNEEKVNQDKKMDVSTDKQCDKSSKLSNGKEKVCESEEKSVTDDSSRLIKADQKQVSQGNDRCDDTVVSNCRTKHRANGSKISKKMAAIEADLLDENFPSLPLGKVNISTKNKLKWNSEDFPSLPAKASESTVQKSTVQKSITEKSSIEPKDTTSLVTDMLQLSLDTYPSLSSPRNVHAGVSKPPPGLDTIPSISAPPGLGGPTPLGNVSSKPPGLEVAVPLTISSVASLITGDSTNASGHTYHEPNNFKERNKKLIFKLKELIHHDADKFYKFKNFSLDFRGDAISAKEFYDGCYELLGKDIFLELLPELLVLLPDICKQKSLYMLCKEEVLEFHNDQSWNVSNVTLFQCSDCEQVLLLTDAISHQTCHDTCSSDCSSVSSAAAKPSTRNAW